MQIVTGESEDFVYHSPLACRLARLAAPVRATKELDNEEIMIQENGM